MGRTTKPQKPDPKSEKSKERPSQTWLYGLWLRFPLGGIFRPLVIRIGLIGILAGTVALAMAYFFAGEIYEYQDTVDGARLPDVDAIVCLAGGRGRIGAAGDLWYRYWERASKADSEIVKMPVLYFSGMGHQMTWTTLSKQFRRGIVHAVQQSFIVIENESSNTDENAKYLAQYAQKRGWKRILLLTSSYHMKRARFIFDHVLKGLEKPIEVETHSVFQEPFTPEEWRTGPNGIRVTIVEYLKWLYYRSVWNNL